MPIISSTYTESPLQADGLRTVYERHEAEDGQVYTFEWQGRHDAGNVLSRRAALLDEQLAEKAEAEAIINGTEAPLSKLEFRALFRDRQEFIDEFNATFEQNPDLTAAQKRGIRTALISFNLANYIRRRSPEVAAAVALYVALGLITPAHGAEITHG